MIVKLISSTDKMEPMKTMNIAIMITVRLLTMKTLILIDQVKGSKGQIIMVLD
jgi:hypothetical protein